MTPEATSLPRPKRGRPRLYEPSLARERQAERERACHKTMRAWRASLGLCPQCGIVPPVTEQRLCRACQDHANICSEKHRLRRLSNEEDYELFNLVRYVIGLRAMLDPSR